MMIFCAYFYKKYKEYDDKPLEFKKYLTHRELGQIKRLNHGFDSKIDSQHQIYG